MKLQSLQPTMQMLVSKTKPLTVSETVRTRGRSWMDTRERILKRDNYLCQCKECKRTDRVRIANEVDHVKPLWEGGADDDTNLQSMHSDCHAIKTARETARRLGGE